MSHLRQLNDFIYDGNGLKEKILKEERNWWFKRKYPKKEYTAFLKKVLAVLKKEGDKYSNQAVLAIDEELGDKNQFKSGPGYSVDILEYITGVFQKLIAKAFQIEKKKQNLSVAKTLHERLAKDSVIFGDNPIEPELVKKISDYVSAARLEQGTKYKMIREYGSQKKRTKERTRKRKRKRKRTARI